MLLSQNMTNGLNYSLVLNQNISNVAKGSVTYLTYFLKMKELVKFMSNLETVIDGNEIAKPSPSVPVNEIIIKPECIEET